MNCTIHVVTRIKCIYDLEGYTFGYVVIKVNFDMTLTFNLEDDDMRFIPYG